MFSRVSCCEGFTGTKGAVKPRSSLDVTDLRSVKSTDDKSPIFVCDSSGKVTLPRATLLAEQTMREGVKDKIYLQTLQGDDKTRDKIIKNISKEVMVEKES